MFKKMEYVYTVYKEKSFTKAAEKLFVSQPALSTAIKKIEEELGLALFDKRHSDIRPTLIGYEYIKAAEKIMNIHEDFNNKVNGISKMHFGQIKIGGTNYVSSYILPRITSAFSKLYPNIQLTLVEANSIELRKMLYNEEIDIIIDSMDEEIPNCQCFPLIEEKILLAVPKEYKCNMGLEKYQISPTDLFNCNYNIDEVPKIPIKHFIDENFILLKKGNSMDRHATDIFNKSGLTPNVSFRLDQLSTSYRYTTCGNGICFIPDKFFKYHHFNDEVLLYSIENGSNRYLYVTHSEKLTTSNIIDKFIKIAKAIIK